MTARLTFALFTLGVVITWGPILLAALGLMAEGSQLIGIVPGGALATAMVVWGKWERATPDGYVGRYRRPDGAVVHVIRTSGVLMVASEEKQGVQARDLGNVSGRELMKWTRLARTPDGEERLARAE